MALLLLFCCSTTFALRRWLKTQAAADSNTIPWGFLSLKG
jgi:hypothetical protein